MFTSCIITVNSDAFVTLYVTLKQNCFTVVTYISEFRDNLYLEHSFVLKFICCRLRI